jgi:nucleolar protein 58
VKFQKFKNTAEALKASAALIDSKLSKSLKKLLKKEISDKNSKDVLALSDAKLGGIIKEKYGIKCIHDTVVDEILRGIRNQVTNLVGELSDQDLKSMSLGLSHSLSRYKLKFSPDKVDTMIVQAIALLDDLDKELNTYAMRVREWYGWHFPELSKIIPDNILYAKSAKKMGVRTNAQKTDFSDFLPEELDKEIKEAAQISMGTEVSEEDIENISALCDQVISISEYRQQLYEYLKNRMAAIAPNLTILVGELVGARLIAHAGSLLNLAKHPASTVQILGAEKALFRALKTKHETPKYGLIYHASLVGQAAPKHKGKISRVLAAKTSLAARFDSFGEGETSTELGVSGRAAVEHRLQILEGGVSHKISGTGKGKAKAEKYDNTMKSAPQYNAATDNTMNMETDSTPSKKDKKEKKQKKEKKEKNGNVEEEAPTESKKRKEPEEANNDGEKKKKKKKKDSQ